VLEHGQEYFNPVIGPGLIRGFPRDSSIPSYFPTEELRAFNSLVEVCDLQKRLCALQFFRNLKGTAETVVFHFDDVGDMMQFRDDLEKSLRVQYVFSGPSTGGRWFIQQPLPWPSTYYPDVFDEGYRCKSVSRGVLMGP
jgi:hypothetical protein